MRLHPVEHAHGAVDRRALLVAGDQQADRAVAVPCRQMRAAAATKAAMAPFMSQAPRPSSTPSRTSAANGSPLQPARPPARRRCGRRSRDAGRLSPQAGVEVRRRRRSAAGGTGSRAAPARREHVQRPGVRRRDDRAADQRLARAAAGRRGRSIAQQLVDGGLGPGLRVHPLDDHGAVRGRARASRPGSGLPGQRARARRPNRPARGP